MENSTVLTLQYDEAIQKLDLTFLASYCEKIYDGEWLVFNEDAHFNKLDLDTLAQKDRYSRYAILFEKDLVIDGALLQSETDTGPLVVIKGKVKAKNFFAGGGELYFRQGFFVEQTIIGVYNHGTTHIKGDIEAELIISDGHGFNFGSEQIKRGIQLGFNNSYRREPTDITSAIYEMEDVLNPKYYDRHNQAIKEKQILKSLIAGVSLKKEGEIETPLQKRITQFRNSKKGILDLSCMNLEEIPSNVFTLEGLIELNLSANYIKSLPERILELKELKKIRLYHCEFTHFPALLSEIVTLEEIDLGKNSLRCLPQDISKLKNLKNLELYNCAFETFPQALYALPNLESLNISYQEKQPALVIDKPLEKLKKLNISANFGAQITASQPELKILNMRNCALIHIPHAITQSLKLTSLDITINGKINSLPEELSQLRKLTDLAIPLANLDESMLSVLHCLSKLATLRLEFREQLPPPGFNKIIELESWTSLYIEGCFEDQFLIRDLLKRPKLKKLVIGDHTVDIRKYRKIYFGKA